MKSLAREALVVGALVSVFVLSAMPVAFADCQEAPPVDQAIAEAPFAFVATVTALEHDERVGRFEVIEVWKGEVESAILVTGGPLLSELEGLAPGESFFTSVDRVFEPGATYLVVPYGFIENTYLDNACTVTQVYHESLDQFRPDTAHPPVEAEADSAMVWARYALGGVALMAAAAFIVTLLRRRRPGVGAG